MGIVIGIFILLVAIGMTVYFGYITVKAIQSYGGRTCRAVLTVTSSKARGVCRA